MPSLENEHFDDYRPQTRIKHRIFSAYLKAYLRILGSSSSDLALIDGFAGRGVYEDPDSGQQAAGSPLVALNVIAGLSGIKDRVTCAFIEPREDWFATLQAVVDRQMKRTPGLRQPIVRCGRFQEEAPRVLQELRNSAGRLPPTFLFVDPCGVSGVSFDVITTVLREPGGEAFIFFNSNGMRRVLGVDAQKRVVSEFFGGEHAAHRLRERLQGQADPMVREQIMLDVYRGSLEGATGARFFLPFRIESEDRQDTSHYLVHVTKHAKGFAIMKHVMLDTVSDDSDVAPTMGLRQASTSYASAEISFSDAEQKRQICEELQGGPRRVSLFTEEWVQRPTDFFSSAQYKRLLKELEAERRLEVQSGDAPEQLKPKPADKRKRAGSVTLGDQLWVRLTAGLF